MLAAQSYDIMMSQHASFAGAQCHRPAAASAFQREAGADVLQCRVLGDDNQNKHIYMNICLIAEG